MRDSARLLGAPAVYSSWDRLQRDLPDDLDRIAGSRNELGCFEGKSVGGLGSKISVQQATATAASLFLPEIFYEREEAHKDAAGFLDPGHRHGADDQLVALVFFGGDGESAAHAFPTQADVPGPSLHRRSGRRTFGRLEMHSIVKHAGAAAPADHILLDCAPCGGQRASAGHFSLKDVDLPPMSAREDAREAAFEAIAAAQSAASAIRDGDITRAKYDTILSTQNTKSKSVLFCVLIPVADIRAAEERRALRIVHGPEGTDDNTEGEHRASDAMASHDRVLRELRYRLAFLWLWLGLGVSGACIGLAKVIEGTGPRLVFCLGLEM